MARTGEDWRPDFEQAMGETFGEAVTPPVPFESEGGPRAGHEAEVAAAHSAVLIPVGRSGGYAATLYARISRPPAIDADTWAVLGASESTPKETARAVLLAVRMCLGRAG